MTNYVCIYVLEMIADQHGYLDLQSNVISMHLKQSYQPVSK